MPKKLTREELEDKALNFVLNAYKSFSNRQGLEDKWKCWDSQYNLELGEDSGDDGRTLSKLFPPELRRALQTIADFIIDVLFPPTSDWFRIKGVDDEADIKNAAVYKKIADVQNEKMMIRSKMIKGIHRLLKYGFLLVRSTKVYKDKYIIAEEKEKSRLKAALKAFLSGVQKMWNPEVDVPKKTRINVYDNVDFTVLSPWKTFWNYKVPWDKQKIVIQEIDDVTVSHLRAQKAKGVYNGNTDAVITAIEAQTVTGEENTSSEKLDHLNSVTGLSDEFNDGIKRGKLLQADCLFDIDQDGYDEVCIITVAITKEGVRKQKGSPLENVEGTVIRMSLESDLQELPVHFTPWDELEDMSLGMGVMQIGEKDQKSLISFTNQTMDSITKILCATKMYDKEMIEEGQNLNTWYNKAIKTKGNPNDVIAYDRPPNVANEAMAAVNMAKANIQNGTRANISLQGLAARYDTTFGEYKEQGNAASRGIMVQIKNLEDNIIKPFLRDQYSYNLSGITRETLITILGRTAATAMLKKGDGEIETKEPNEVIMGDYDFVPLGVTQTENKVIRGQQLINFISTALKIEPIKPGLVDWAFVLSKTWETIGDGDNRILLPQSNEPSLDPEDENVLLSQGAEVHISQMDDDKMHVQAHLNLQLIPEFDKNRLAHIKEHMISQQQKLMRATTPVVGPGNQNPTFQPKLPMPGNNGQVPGVVRAPAGMA